MTARIDLTFDCANPARLAAFWKLALGYEDEPPPAPFATREEWLRPGDPATTRMTAHGCTIRPGSAPG